MIISYDTILDNCINRKHANLNKVKEYIGKYDWESIILPRHIPFIQNYIENKYILDDAVRNSVYSHNDMLSIFLRIESQFELYEKHISEFEKFNELIIHRDELKNCDINESKKVKRTYKKREKKKDKIKVNPNMGTKEKDEKIKYALGLIQGYPKSKIDTILGKKLATYVDDLFNGKTISEIAINRKMSEKYLSNTLLGVKTPRRKSEMGLQKLIEEYDKK